MVGVNLENPTAFLKRTLEKLTENGQPPPAAAHLLDVGTGSYIDFFDDEILGGLIASGGSTFRLFEGAHGSGKSHLLQLIEARARVRGFATVRIDLSVALALSDLKAVVSYVLKNIIWVSEDRVIFRGLPKILEGLGQKPRLSTAEMEKAMLPHEGFKNAMVCGLQPGDYSEEGQSLL